MHIIDIDQGRQLIIKVASRRMQDEKTEAVVAFFSRRIPSERIRETSAELGVKQSRIVPITKKMSIVLSGIEES